MTLLLPSARTLRAAVIWRVLALGAIAGPVLFTTAWLVLGAVSTGYTILGTRIAPYSPITQPISGLGLGDTGRYMNPAFILTGALLLAGVVGVVGSLPASRRRPLRWLTAALLALPAVGFVFVGLFTLEQPVLHLSGAMLILGSPIIGFVVTGIHLRGIEDWRRCGTALLIAGPVTLGLFVLYNVSFSQSATAAGHGFAGLTQRMLFVEILAWFVTMGLLACRKATSGRT